MVPTTPMMQAFNQRDPGFIGTQRYFYNVIRTHLILMKRILALAAAASAATLPSAALAATSGTVSASMTVGYSCDITVPANQTLIASGTTATVTATLPYTQNGDTDFSLTALSVTKPAGADVSGSIVVKDVGGTTLVNNTSTSSSATGATNEGSESGNGSVVFTLTEGTAASFTEGAYAISSTLSCSES